MMVGEIYAQSGHICLVDDEDFDAAGVLMWKLHSSGKNFVNDQTIDGERVLTTLRRFVWKRMARDAPHALFCVDLDFRNCTRSNLTAFPPNNSNAAMLARSEGPREITGGRFKGVAHERRGNVWRAAITVAGDRKTLGSHATPELAASAYDAAAFAAWGADCFLNFPENYGLPPRGETP